MQQINCECGHAATRGAPTSFVGSVMGKSIGEFRFVCDICDPEKLIQMAVNPSKMYPGWKIISQGEPGVYWLRKLTEYEQNKMTTPEA